MCLLAYYWELTEIAEVISKRSCYFVSYIRGIPYWEYVVLKAHWGTHTISGCNQHLLLRWLRFLQSAQSYYFLQKQLTCCFKNEDSKELKRQRERERYALNREDILRRKKEAREHKNAAAAMDNGNSEANALVSPSVASHGESWPIHIYTSHVCYSHRLLISTTNIPKYLQILIKSWNGKRQGSITHYTETRYWENDR